MGPSFSRRPGVVPCAHPEVEHFTPLFTTLGAADSSAAAQIAAALPDSKVLKAFNTTFGPTLAASEQIGWSGGFAVTP